MHVNLRSVEKEKVARKQSRWEISAEEMLGLLPCSVWVFEGKAWLVGPRAKIFETQGPARKALRGCLLNAGIVVANVEPVGTMITLMPSVQGDLIPWASGRMRPPGVPMMKVLIRGCLCRRPMREVLWERSR